MLASNISLYVRYYLRKRSHSLKEDVAQLPLPRLSYTLLKFLFPKLMDSFSCSMLASNVSHYVRYYLRKRSHSLKEDVA